MKNQNLINTMIAMRYFGIPTPSFGKSEPDEKETKKSPGKKADEEPAKESVAASAEVPAAPVTPEGEGEPYINKGVPLHGDPTQGGTHAEPSYRRNEDDTLDSWLERSRQVTEPFQALDLPTAPEEGSRYELVRFRTNLQRFRAGNEEAVDAETNRIEAMLLGKKVSAGQ